MNDSTLKHEGGCLCGALRYATSGEPERTNYCHCKFCQRATGSAYLVEAMYPRARFALTKGTPARYALKSSGSGKEVVVNFCATCGTKIHLDLERAPDAVGVYVGTYDDPNWFNWINDETRHIFLESAQRGTMVPAGVQVFHQHFRTIDGKLFDPLIFEEPHHVE